MAMLQRKLANILQRELDSQNLLLSNYGTQQLEGLIGRGVLKMRNSKADENPGRMLNAEQSLKHLVRYLANHARNEGTHPQLGNFDFDKAMREAPTFWPFTASE